MKNEITRELMEATVESSQPTANLSISSRLCVGEGRNQEIPK